MSYIFSVPWDRSGSFYYLAMSESSCHFRRRGGDSNVTAICIAQKNGLKKDKLQNLQSFGPVPRELMSMQYKYTNLVSN